MCCEKEAIKKVRVQPLWISNITTLVMRAIAPLIAVRSVSDLAGGGEESTAAQLNTFACDRRPKPSTGCLGFNQRPMNIFLSR